MYTGQHFSDYYLRQECQKIKSLCHLDDWACKVNWFNVAGKYDVHVKKSVRRKAKEMDQGVLSSVTNLQKMIINIFSEINQKTQNYLTQISRLKKNVEALRQNTSDERQRFNQKIATLSRTLSRTKDNLMDQLSQQRQLKAQKIASLQKDNQYLKVLLHKSKEENKNNQQIILKYKEQVKLKDYEIKAEQQKFNKLMVEYQIYKKKMQSFIKQNDINSYKNLQKDIKNQNELIKAPSSRYSGLSSRSFSQKTIPKMMNSSQGGLQNKFQDDFDNDTWVLPFPKYNFMKEKK